LKKLQTSQDDELESPDCDPLFILPQRIIDQDEHEIIVEISDEELVAWEKEQQKEKLEMSDDEDEEKEKEKLKMTLATMNATDTKMEKDPTFTGKFSSISLFYLCSFLHLSKIVYCVD
jgi:hypothetical protein